MAPHLLFVLLLIATPSITEAAGAAFEPYDVPVVGSYVIQGCRGDSTDASTAKRTLVEVHSLPTRFGRTYSTIVQDVQQYAVTGQLIVGTTREGYFLLDTRSDSAPQTYTTAADWKAAGTTL